jgi:predicted small secreted protein
MRSGIRHVLCGVVLTLLAVVATGCSHNTLSGASQDLSVTFTPSPPGAGRYTGVGSDNATFIINKLQVLPADPATAALYGTQQLLLRFTPFDPTGHPHLLTETAESEFSHIALSTGTYRVTVIEVTPPVLVDDNVSPTPASCIEGIAVIDGSSPPDQVPASFPFSFPTPADTPAGMTFTIRPGQTKLALKVNVPGLIAGYEASYTCQLGCGPGGSPCLTAFSVPNFRAALLANLTIE